MLCRRCGNEIDDAAAGCVVCAASANRAPAATPSRPSRERDADDVRWILCPHCGNQVVAGQECPICADQRARRKARRDADERHLCLSCGNEVFGTDPCPVCTSGRAFRKKRASESETSLCRGCGNVVDDPAQCPICRDRKGIRGRPKDKVDVPMCPHCEEALEEQDWDGVLVLTCADCNGCFFLGNGLEEMLGKLRTDAQDSDLREALQEFRGRHQQALPKQVRYKPCPVCAMSMTRRNYARISGIIIDHCGVHGTWTDQSTFGELSDFVSTGADKLGRRR
jgi:Zn-finger nucleic acid-binding protein